MTLALTVTQPYATAIALGHKTVETRSWTVRHRGRLLIHAAKGKPDRGLEQELYRRRLLPWRFIGPGLPLGEIVAVAQLVDVRPVTKALRESLSPLEQQLGDYSPGRYAWILADVFPIEPGVPARGRLMLWEGPDL